MGLGDPTNPISGLLSGLFQGFAGGLTQGIERKAEERRAKIGQEAKFLNEVLNDTAGQYSQADRDAAIYALAELSRGDKPGAGLKSFEKRRKELMEQQTALATGAVAGGGKVAGAPASLAPSPVIGGNAPLPGSAEAAEAGGTPGRPASYRPGGPPEAPGAEPSAAMPATSPTVSRGTAAGIAPGAPIGQPPAPAPQPPAGGAPAPAQGPPGAPPEAPTQEQIAEFGRGMGLTPPAQPTPPQQPDPYTARKLDLEFYKQDMLQYKTDSQAYTEWFERVAIQMRQERKQKEDQDFRAKESEKERGFKKEEGEKERSKDLKVAGIRAAGAGSGDDKNQAMIRRQAINEYHNTLNEIDRAKDEFGVGSMKESEKQARRERAAANYRAATGEDPPDKSKVDHFEPPAPGKPAEGKGKKLPGGPPEAPQTLDELQGGAEIRSRIEAARRQKVDPKKICADIAQLPATHQAAAKLYARCP